MRAILVLVAGAWLLGPGCRSSEEAYLDPVAVAPELYFLELENDSVRVLREKVPAGTEVPMHSHLARVSVVLSDAEVELAPRGGEPSLRTNVAGTVELGAPVTHGGRTLGDVENLSIELKELGGETIPVSERNGTIVDPARHVVESEDDAVRVVRSTYPAGAESRPHEHGPGLSVALSGFQYSESVGGVEPVEWETRETGFGETAWSEAGTAHAIRNDSGDDVVILRVELKRKPAPSPN